MTMYSRQQSERTKQKISQAMKLKHAQRTPDQKAQTRQKQSDTMKRIWSRVPDHVSMDDFLGIPDDPE